MSETTKNPMDDIFEIGSKEDVAKASEGGIPEGIYNASVLDFNPDAASFEQLAEEHGLRGKHREYAKQAIGSSVLTRIQPVFELDGAEGARTAEMLLDNSLEVTLNGSASFINGLGSTLTIRGFYPELANMDQEASKAFVEDLNSTPEKRAAAEKLLLEKVALLAEQQRQESIANGKRHPKFDTAWVRPLRRGEAYLIEFFTRVINFRLISRKMSASDRAKGLAKAMEYYGFDPSRTYEGEFGPLQKVVEKARAGGNMISVFAYAEPYTNKDGGTSYASRIWRRFDYFSPDGPNPYFVKSLLNRYGDSFRELPNPEKIAGRERFTAVAPELDKGRNHKPDLGAFRPHMFDPSLINAPERPGEGAAGMPDLGDEPGF